MRHADREGRNPAYGGCKRGEAVLVVEDALPDGLRDEGGDMMNFEGLGAVKITCPECDALLLVHPDDEMTLCDSCGELLDIWEDHDGIHASCRD
jgi:hypothetical protein